MTKRAADAARLELEFEPQRRSVRACRQAIGEYAQRVGADPSVVSLAVSEAASNVVFHAYRNRERRPFTMSAEVDDAHLVVTVADRGSGMKPNPESTGLGLGLSIISNVADSVEFDSGEGGLTVAMRFALNHQPTR
jgi:serine/threonine-protein kinase RsbW/stage II sporulation protein AB (anti-sigma F factor)